MQSAKKRGKRCTTTVFMKVLTYNIRGLGGRAKRKVIKKLIAKEGVELLCIQEIKVEVITKEMCVAVWR